MKFAIETYIWARALHVLGVVIWIGGVFFVTAVLLPMLKKQPVDKRLPLFAALENNFSWFARISWIVVAVSGFILEDMIGLWYRMSEPQLWPIHLMLTTTLTFGIMLFIIEPIFGERYLERYAERHPDKAFRLMSVVHWGLTILSVVTIIAGTLLAHGYAFAL